MQKLQMNLPQDQLELLAPTVFLVKEITGLLPLNSSVHFVCSEPNPSPNALRLLLLEKTATSSPHRHFARC